MGEQPSFHDYIFVIAMYEADQDWWLAYVTPHAYFDRNRCIRDQHLKLTVPGWAEVQEGQLERVDGRRAPAQLHDELISLGFRYSRELHDFLKDLHHAVFDGTTVTLPSSE